jgi:pyruvate,water dikinase
VDEGRAEELRRLGSLPPGFWSPDVAHFPKPVSRATAWVLAGRQSAAACRRWGVLVVGVDFAIDGGGFVHVRDEMVHDPAEARARWAAADETVGGARWRVEAARWDDEARPALVARLLALQDVALDGLDDVALAAHVLAVAAEARAGIDLHMELHLTDMVPLGALLAEGEGWGLTPEDVLGLLPGSSPASAPSAALLAARAAVAEGRHDLPEVAAFLRSEGHHLVSEPEAAGVTLHERPDLVDRLLRDDLAVTSASSTAGVDDGAVAALRAAVPAAERDRFDELAADARRTYGIRDDNTSLTMMWPLGLVRRAYRAAASRLPDLASPDDVFDADPDELAARLRGAAMPDGRALADRAARRAVAATRGPGPAQIDDWAPPDPSLMNASQRWLQDAFDAYNRHFGSGARYANRPPMSGIGIGDRSVTGPAVVAATPLEALDRLAAGAVLVVTATAPAYDAVLPLAAGLVVETGGLLCHAALAARELGLPAVVAVVGATRAIADGDLVTVDPGRGRVEVSRGSSSPRR